MSNATPFTNLAGGDASWYDEAKLGIMLSWGLYSIPGWAPRDPRLTESLGGEVASEGGSFAHMSPLSTTSYAEWYLNSMSLVGTPTWLYHQANYAGAPYDDFRPAFEAAVAACSPEDWVDLSKAAGARYIVPLTKHHDGYLLYPSTIESPFRPGYHTNRDIIGEIASAARSNGLRFGAYYSGGIDWTAAGLPIPSMEYLADDRVARTARYWPDEYARYADAQYREIIERYEPSILWNDIGYPKAGRASEMFEYYYSKVPDGVINDRFYEPNADFATPEYHRFGAIRTAKWEMNRGVGLSFGFNQTEGAADTLTCDELVLLLLNVVSRNGNLMLGIGPDAGGRISPFQEASLRGLGQWLATNGEAIYSTRPWTRSEDSLGAGTVHWTQGSDALYATVDNLAGDIILSEDAARFSLDDARALDPSVFLNVAASADGVKVALPREAVKATVIKLPFRNAA